MSVLLERLRVRGQIRDRAPVAGAAQLTTCTCEMMQARTTVTLPDATNRTDWPWHAKAPELPPTMPDGAPWPRITIVTPALNQGAYIEATIRSVLLQGYPNLEYIVMDGGSTDNTVAILERYSPWLSFWTSGPDGGQSDAIGRGFDRATGELLAWLCSDDLYLPGALAFAAQAFARQPDAVLICGETSLDQGNGWEDWMAMGFSEMRPTYTRLLASGQCVQQPGCFWPADAYRRVGGLDRDLNFCMDYDLFVKLCSTGKAVFDRREVAWMRSHAASKSSTLHEVRVSERALIVDRALRRQTVSAWRLCAANYANTIRTTWRDHRASSARKALRTLRLAAGFTAQLVTGAAYTWHPPTRATTRRLG